MKTAQIVTKSIWQNWKRTGQFLCATALATSAALSAFAPRAAIADFTLHYDGTPFDKSTCYANAANFKVAETPTEIDCLSGNIELSLTYAGSIKNNYTGDMGTEFKNSVLKIKGETYVSTIRINSLHLSDGHVSYSNINFSAYNSNENGHGDIIGDSNSTTSNEYGYEKFVYYQNKKSIILYYGYGNDGTWTITGDIDNGDGDNGNGNDADPMKEANEGKDCKLNTCEEGNPINVGTGNKYQVEADYEGSAYTDIELIRHYNSQDSRTSQFGANWRSTWDRVLEMPDDKTVKAVRTNGRVYTFTQSGNGWSATPGVTLNLSGSAANGWTLVDDNDNTETYSGKGQLQSVKTRTGEVTTLSYENTAAALLASVYGPYGHSLHFHHNSDGLVDQVTQPDGKALNYAYDGNKNLISVQYQDGTTSRYVYNEAANTSGANLPHALTGKIDGNGARFATYRYDAQNRAVSTEHAGGIEKVTVVYNADGSATVNDALGNTHGYNFTTSNNIVLPTAVTGVPVANIGAKVITYDQYGFIASRTDFNGNITTYTHTARGQETSRTEASGTPLARTFTTAWHPKFNLPTQITEPSGVPGVNRVTTFDYDNANGALLRKTVSAGGQSRVWTFVNDAQGHPTKITGPRGDVTTITYGSGAPIAIKDALGYGYSLTYDSDGRRVSIIDPNGLARRTTYTPRGQVATSSVGLETTTYTYDAAQNLVGVTQPDEAHYTYQNDAAHQLVRILDALGNHQELTHDLKGNVTMEQVVNADGALVRQRSHAYDAVNRLVQDIGAAGQTTTYVRDGNGNIAKFTDALGNNTTYDHDALNRVTRMTAPDGGVTEIAYNPDNSVAAIKDPRGNETLYSYDGLGNQTAEQSPDRGKITRTFDAAGNVLTVTDGRGLTTTNTYDLLNRLTYQQFSDGTALTFNYDEHASDMYANGRLTSVVDPSGTTSFVHDQTGHVIRKTQVIGGVTLTTTKTYDQQTGHLTTTVLPSGATIEYGYNAKTGKPETITVNGQALISGIGYEPFSNQVKLWSEGDGSVNLYYLREFDQDGNITKVVFGDTSANDNWGGQRILYSYDKSGRLLCTNNNDYQDICNEYDGNSRLTGFKTQVPAITDGVYAYDLNGNRTWSTDALGDRDNHISPFNNQLQTVTSGSTTQTLTYDQGGNLTQDDKFTYTTDAWGKFARVNGSGVDMRYAYNGLGERVKKEGASGMTVFAQEGYQVLGEYTGMVPGTGKAVAVQETVYLDGLPIGVIKPSRRYYVNPSPLGSPLAITNTAGTLVWSWEHAPFGDTLPNENPKGAGTFSYNLRFPGQYYDAETGLHYNMARDYNPALGRYIQSDPIGLAGGINPYAYVNGNPLWAVDPWGLTAACPVSPPVNDPNWGPYVGNPWWFHCGSDYHTYLENRQPTPQDPKGECTYDDCGSLVDDNHRYKGCHGTPDQYDASDWLNHTFNDHGGIWKKGWPAFFDSRKHEYNQLIELVKKMAK